MSAVNDSWYDSSVGRLILILLFVLAFWAGMTLAGALGDWYRTARHSVALHHDMRAGL